MRNDANGWLSLSEKCTAVSSCRRFRWRTSIWVWSCLCLWIFSPSRVDAQELVLATQSAFGQEAILSQQLDQFAASTGVTVRLATYALPRELKLARNRTELRRADVYLFSLDDAPQFNPFLRDLTEQIDTAPFMDLLVAAMTIDERLIAVPYAIDIPMLYANRALLRTYDSQMPQTYAALTQTAQMIMQSERQNGNARQWGYVFSADPGTMLPRLLHEWLAAFGAPQPINHRGMIVSPTARSAQALTQAQSWIDQFVPRQVLRYDQAQADQMFVNGDSVFLRSGISALRAIRKAARPEYVVAPLPRGQNGEGIAYISGFALAAAQAQNAQAVALIRYLTSERTQRRALRELAYLPTRTALYRGGVAAQWRPTLSKIALSKANVTLHQSHHVDQVLAHAANQVLSSAAPAQQALEEMEVALKRTRQLRWDD